MKNKSGLKLRRSRIDWQKFDALPLALKEICWEFNVHWGNRDVHQISDMKSFAAAARERMQRKQVEATLAAYGPDHPGAWALTRPASPEALGL